MLFSPKSFLLGLVVVLQTLSKVWLIQNFHPNVKKSKSNLKAEYSTIELATQYLIQVKNKIL